MWSNVTLFVIGGLLSIPVLQLLWNFLWYYTTLSQRIKWNGYYGCPKYQHRDLLFGSDFQRNVLQENARGTRQTWYREQFRKYGKTYEVKQWSERIFHTCDVANAKAILFSQADHFSVAISRAPSRPWLGAGVFTTDGEFWKHSRNLTKPIFAKSQIVDLDRLERHLQRLFQRLSEDGNQGDLQALFNRMYLDYSLEFLFGDEQDSLTGTKTKIEAGAFIAAFDKSLIRLRQAQLPWVIRWWKGWTVDWLVPFQASQGYVKGRIQDALDGKISAVDEQSMVFINELIRQTENKDVEYLYGQMMNLFFASRDGSAFGCSLAFFFLSRNADCWKKVREEVDHANEHLTYESVKNLRYVTACADEALRMYIPVGHAFRHAIVDSVLPTGGGISGREPLFIPAGSAVIAHIDAIQRDKEFWGSDADVFRPERWLEQSTVQLRKDWHYLPFLGGGRTCPAQAMVKAQIAYIIARFAQQYRECQSTDAEKRLIEEYRITLKIRNGVGVKVTS